MAKVNVNTATREELVDVVGLSPETAAVIVELRREHGRLGGIELLEASGRLDEAALDRLRRTLDFSDPDAARAMTLQLQANEQVAELGRLFMELLQEQSAHNMEAMLLLGRATDARQMAQLQEEFIRLTIKRLSRFTTRYLEIVEQAMQPPPKDPTGPVERAA
jgi:hypothetical protein